MRAQIAASEARTKAALIVYDQTVLRALQEMDDAFKAYDAANKTFELHQLESVAHSDAARLAQLRFSLGEGIYSDVLEAQKSDFISRRALAIAYTNQQLAIVSIYKALGGVGKFVQRKIVIVQGLRAGNIPMLKIKFKMNKKILDLALRGNLMLLPNNHI